MPAIFSAIAGVRVTVFAQEELDVGLNVLSAGGHVVAIYGPSFSVDKEFLKVPANVAVADRLVVQPLGVTVVVPRRWTIPLMAENLSDTLGRKQNGEAKIDVPKYFKRISKRF